MKRHVQFEGVRKWAGDHLLELQSEPLKVLDRFFGQYGSFVLAGCEMAPAANAAYDDGGPTSSDSYDEEAADLYDVAPGLMVLAGRDRGGNDVVMAVPFAGATGVPLPLYLTLEWSVRQFEYVEGGVKPIAYDYYAKASTVEPAAATPHLLLNDNTPRFADAIQDDRHQFLTAQQVADLEKSPRYRGSIATGNADGYRAYGVYNLALGTGAVNFPAAGMKGVMIVSVADDQTSQQITDFSTGIIWTRSLFGGVWSPWSQAMKNDFSNAEYDPSWHLFAQNGYWQSPDGLLVQWGFHDAGGTTVTLYFPKAFKEVYAVTIQRHRTTGTSEINTSRVSPSSFVFSSNNADCYWIAVGTWK